MKTTDHETGHGEQLIQIILIVIFFSGFAVAGGVLLIGAKIYDLGDRWWNELFGEGENY